MYQQTRKEVLVQWSIANIEQNPKPLKNRRLSKKQQQQEDEVKIKLEKSNDGWNDWRFQLHWYQL